jgi:hypothetical protein
MLLLCCLLHNKNTTHPERRFETGSKSLPSTSGWFKMEPTGKPPFLFAILDGFLGVVGDKTIEHSFLLLGRRDPRVVVVGDRV